MAEFYIEKTAKDSGEHLIHFSTCSQLPEEAELDYLGSIASYESAQSKGKQRFHAVNACTACASKYATA